MKKIAMSLTVLFILSITLVAFVGCSNSNNEEKTIILATTTSTYDSGLLDFILPAFTEETGIEVQVISVGTGAAIQLGRDGEADVLLVHDRVQEDTFVADGFAEARFDVMYNDFVVVGSSSGAINHNTNVGNTFTSIFDNELTFVSRGDNSGTHSRELLLWSNLNLNPEDNPNYLEAGQGMGATIGMTAEMEGYTLSDRATWLSYASKGDLVIVCEHDPTLLNPYGVMVVSSTLRPNNAKQYVDWLRGSKAQGLIAEFGVAEFGEPLFFPDA